MSVVKLQIMIEESFNYPSSLKQDIEGVINTLKIIYLQDEDQNSPNELTIWMQ